MEKRRTAAVASNSGLGIRPRTSTTSQTKKESTVQPPTASAWTIAAGIISSSRKKTASRFSVPGRTSTWTRWSTGRNSANGG